MCFFIPHESTAMISIYCLYTAVIIARFYMEIEIKLTFRWKLLKIDFFFDHHSEIVTNFNSLKKNYLKELKKISLLNSSQLSTLSHSNGMKCFLLQNCCCRSSPRSDDKLREKCFVFVCIWKVFFPQFFLLHILIIEKLSREQSEWEKEENSDDDGDGGDCRGHKKWEREKIFLWTPAK